MPIGILESQYHPHYNPEAKFYENQTILTIRT
uniref:Uncharacterized protein n=1 Tax=Setaria italica TaxID=4555 RepID=K3ZPM8_SETIT